MLIRDYGRICDCEKRMNVMPLGSGALASTTYPINRERVAELLGFPAVTENSIDGVSDRDFVIELASALSIFDDAHEPLFPRRSFSGAQSEFGFIELDDAYSTGSSMNGRRKRTPTSPSWCAARPERIYGDLMTLLTMMKSLPLRSRITEDMQEEQGGDIRRYRQRRL